MVAKITKLGFCQTDEQHVVSNRQQGQEEAAAEDLPAGDTCSDSVNGARRVTGQYR